MKNTAPSYEGGAGDASGGMPVGTGNQTVARSSSIRQRPAELFLPRLNRLKDLGRGRYRASCPTSQHEHGDRSAGLSILIHDDDRILMRCPFGCDIYEIVAAMGLTISDLFPDNPTSAPRLRRSERPTLSHRDLLTIIRHEALVAHIGAEKLGRGEGLTDDDRQRLALAAGRILTALDVGGVLHERR